MAVRNLIIKSSYSKLEDGSLKSNFGDLLRCTVLLGCLENDFLWLTDSRSVPLLKWFVDREKLITYDENGLDCMTTKETRIINVDNYIPDKKMFERLEGKWSGYVWNGADDVSAGNDLIRCTEPYTKFDCGLSWQEALLRGMGFEWHGQDYSRNHVKKNRAVYDVGLNWNVHQDWTSKKWPEESWKELENILAQNYSVSWQKGLNDLDQYIDWISSCKLIVTCDTLGLHLASALGKKVIAITGVTECNEHPYGRVKFAKPETRDCMPCNKPVCKYGKTCLESVTADRISRMVIGTFNRSNKYRMAKAAG